MSRDVVARAAVTMVAVLGAWFTSWRLSHALGLHVDVVVLSTVLALTLSRTFAQRPRRLWLRLVTLPVMAVAAGGVGRLMLHHEWVGGAVFCVALAAAVWVRRFGPLAARLGTLVTLPFIVLLVVPVPLHAGTADTWWPAVFGLLAYVWVVASFVLAWRLEVLATPPLEPEAAVVRRPGNGRWSATSRMALQTLVGLGISYALGRWWFPDHWAWMLISSYVVMSGNRGRGDVVHKGLNRVVGALGGTVAATLLAGAVPAGNDWTIVALFVVMALSTWLRDAGYVWWAAGVTAMLALLHGYYGVSGGLGQRLEAVALGSLVAIAVSWFVTPIRSRDVFRRRWADALAALSDDLAAQREGRETGRLGPALREVELLEPTYLLHRRVTRRAGPADLVAALREVHRALGDVDDASATTLGGWARQVGAIRRRMRGELSEPVEVPAAGEAEIRVSRALAHLDREFSGEVWRRIGGDPDATKRADVAS